MIFYHILLGCLLCLLPIKGLVWAEQPIPQTGKKTVFERVVSHPGATLYEDEGLKNKIGNPRTFTSYYVYEKKGDLLKVGVSATKSDGWIKRSETTYWPHAITMLFTRQMGRSPVLFFKDNKSLAELCASDGIEKKVAEYVRLFNTPGANIPEDIAIVATEPLEKDGQVSQNNFYLMPVLAMDDQFSEGGTQLLKVASIDPGTPQKAAENKSSGMKTGIVFVIDTTKSMGPYIDQTREIIRKVYDQLQKSPAKDDVAIAVVAFRSNEKLRPKTQYNTKIISDFKTVDKREELENMLASAEECQASTHDFDEDSLAGVARAIDSLSWDGIDSKAMLLITDAGPLGAGDPASHTGMSPEGMADLLRTNNIFLTVAHIRSPLGKNDHAYAEKSYRELSRMENNRSSYIPINAPTPEQGAKSFDQVGSIIADRYCHIAELTQKGEMSAKPVSQDVADDQSPGEKARHIANAIGYAMQLQFAGNRKGTSAPSVMSAWIADADLPELEKNPDSAPVPVVEPAVLLTKSQLSQLRKQLNLIVETAEEAFLRDSKEFNFYEQLMSAAAKMSSDPSAFNSDPEANLAQKGILAEVLDGLPYKSQVLRLKQEDWQNMSTGEQQEFIKRLKGLISRYDAYDSDNQHWESFGSPYPNEWVYRVPLNMLP